MRADDMTLEEKKDLIKRLKYVSGSRPYFYLKFCKKEQYAHDICAGKIHVSTPRYFRDIEIERGERGQGDKNELTLDFETGNGVLSESTTGKPIVEFSKAYVTLRFNGDEDIPILSFVGIPIEDMILKEFDGDRARFMLPFSPDELSYMERDFGEYCVIIDGRELEKRIYDTFKKNKIDYVFESVKYCDNDSSEKIRAYSDMKIPDC